MLLTYLLPELAPHYTVRQPPNVEKLPCASVTHGKLREFHRGFGSVYLRASNTGGIRARGCAKRTTVAALTSLDCYYFPSDQSVEVRVVWLKGIALPRHLDFLSDMFGDCIFWVVGCFRSTRFGGVSRVLPGIFHNRGNWSYTDDLRLPVASGQGSCNNSSETCVDTTISERKHCLVAKSSTNKYRIGYMIFINCVSCNERT